MENFKFVIFSIIVIALVGFGGYWAFSTMESGSVHVANQIQKELEFKNEKLTEEIILLKNEISVLKSKNEEEAPVIKEEVLPVKTPEVKVTDTTKTPVLKHQNLINELQKLVDGNIYLKIKSQGAAVGSVQNFLNIYNNTSNKIDNDYGLSTSTAIKSFQKAQGLTVDGEVGPGTFRKMISWLKTK